MSTKFAELAQKFEETRKTLMEQAQAAIIDEFKRLFAEYPEITGIVWTQYTPYFNDGDTCEFSIHDWTITNVQDVENVTHYGEYEGDDENVMTSTVDVEKFAVYSYYDKNKKYSQIWELEKFAHTDLGHQVFEQAYGDHVKVTVTPSGVEIEEYDHE